MNSLWASLIPLILGSAIVPIQIIITILLLRSASGKKAAVAWIAGMTAVRLVQGLVFGLILSSGDITADSTSDDGGSPVVSVALLVVAMILLVTGLRQLLTDHDPDAPPPKWLTMTETITPARAFLMGAGLLAIGAKFWVFTLAAISAIGDADLGQPAASLSFLTFVVLAQSAHLMLVAIATLVPARSDAVLTATSTWLTKHNRVIVIVLSVVFGAWFMAKALDGLGVI